MPNLSDEQEAYTQVANDLATWIDAAPLLSSYLQPVYIGHVVLCELIRDSAHAQERINELEREVAELQEAKRKHEKNANEALCNNCLYGWGKCVEKNK
jgi:hypothetical protein